MSAIFGIYYPEGCPATQSELEQMAESLNHRGPDGSGLWMDGPAGLGHQMLWTTPESLYERLPMVGKTGHLVITADARIDNREELIGLLKLEGRAYSEISDSEIILAAYEEWGEACPEKLLGDFAFAIWDSLKQSLFCARDHFGIKPFYYHATKESLYFASEIKGLLCMPRVSRRLNETMVAEHLTTAFTDREITFYKDILRLPPSHRMSVSREGIRLESYWYLNPFLEQRLGSNEDYAEAFRDLFSEAVRCRLRSAFPVGSMLSGGLDSSSITCMARKLLDEEGKGRLLTFSAVFDEIKQCDERPFINAVLDKYELDPHFLKGDRLGPLTDLDRVLWHEDKPVFGPNLFLRWGLYGTACKQGVRAILDGFDGDGVVSYGLGYLDELARAGRWLTLALEVKAVSKNFGHPPWKPFINYLRFYGINPVISKSKILRTLRRIWRSMNRRDARIGTQSTKQAERFPLLNPDFVRRTDLEQRYKAWRKTQPLSARSERERHYRTLTQDALPLALETLDSISSAFSIETRYPFWDKRLVEFCLALPPEQKLNRGFNRIVMRRAMNSILPPQIQWRGSKTNFTPVFHNGLLSFDRDRLDGAISDGQKEIEEYVNMVALRDLYSRIVCGQSPDLDKDLLAFWRVASLVLWMRHSLSFQTTREEVMSM